MKVNYYDWKFLTEVILAEYWVLDYVKNESNDSNLKTEVAKKEYDAKDNKTKSLIV